MRRLPRSLLLPFCVLLAASPGRPGDVIELHNAPKKEVGAIVDGRQDNGLVNDARYLKLDLGSFFDAVFPIIPLEEFTPDESVNEIIGFARGRPPVLVPDVPWTPFEDRIDLVFEDEYRIPLHIWIVYGPFEDQRARAAEAVVDAATTWAGERTGLAFGDVEIVDATEDPDVEPFVDFTCEADAAAIKDEIGHVPGRVNVYYVKTVDFGGGPFGGAGVYCRSQQIVVLGRWSFGLLLAHELGHAFSLRHPGGAEAEAHFDDTNVMVHSSGDWEFFTEGQNFRAVYDPTSVLNDLYDIRDGRPTRSCPHHYSTLTRSCPAVQKRVWADGESWPPN